ncbi:hypothetical protein HYV72_00205, partial [Candidatus Uhrbacteria bacterium]|nr:hypothetical protein [Candidatus Uhrbacteria bacterium]
MAFRHIRKQQFENRRVDTGVRSKWPARIGVIILVLVVLAAAGYDFPGVWNRSIGRIPRLAMHAPGFRLGLDLLGGAHLEYEADLSQVEFSGRAEALSGVRDVIERRVNAFGLAEPVVQTSLSGEKSRVIVALAGVRDINEAIRHIGETPILEFKKPATPTEGDEAATDETNAERKKLAQDLLGRALKGENFESLVEEYSQGPQKSVDGISGWVDDADERARVLPGRGLEVGRIYINVLEKDAWYSVVKYHSTREANEWLYSDIVICYEGATGCSNTERTRAEARREARALADELTPDTFAARADERTDDAAAKGSGGDRDWNRQRILDVNLAVGLASH